MKFNHPNTVVDADLPIRTRAFGGFQDVQPLLALCSSGKLYEVEEWIQAGRPLQFPPSDDRKLRRRPTALGLAVSKGFHSLAALLLANGYDPNGDNNSALATAARDRRSDMVDLLLRFGADVNTADLCDVLETCDRSLMDRFIEAGADPCAENALARALGLKGRPILGFVKQYRDRFPGIQRQIDIALRVATEEESLKGIALFLWVGANPHATVPSSPYVEDAEQTEGETAFERGLWATKPEILPMFLKHPIPRDRVDSLFRQVAHRPRPDVIKLLLAAGADPNSVEDGYPALYCFFNSLLWVYRERSTDNTERSFEALELALKAGAKWKLEDQQLKRLRRDLADGESAVVVRLLDLAHKYEAIPIEQLLDLTRTPAV